MGDAVRKVGGEDDGLCDAFDLRRGMSGGRSDLIGVQVVLVLSVL